MTNDNFSSWMVEIQEKAMLKMFEDVKSIIERLAAISMMIARMDEGF